MTIEAFRAACLARFGYGWQSKFARWAKINPRTVRKWVAGENPIPGWVAVLLRENTD